jgi:hypothetical protein
MTTRAPRTGFTVQSWNHAAPETFPTSVLALTAATFRAKIEGTLVQVLDNVTDEQAEVHADGHVGKWL